MMSESDMLDQALKMVRYNGFQLEKVRRREAPPRVLPTVPQLSQRGRSSRRFCTFLPRCVRNRGIPARLVTRKRSKDPAWPLLRCTQAIDASDLGEVLRFSYYMLRELKSAPLSPRLYYALYTETLERLRPLEQYFEELAAREVCPSHQKPWPPAKRLRFALLAHRSENFPADRQGSLPLLRPSGRRWTTRSCTSASSTAALCSRACT